MHKVEDEKPEGRPRYGHSHIVETTQHGITEKNTNSNSKKW